MSGSQTPLVSIMIPCFNQAQYLEEAVNSALAQTYGNLEVVISDDGSSDETPQIAQQWANHEKVRYFRNEPNLGRVKNYRETLFNRAQGTYVLNLDGDDVLLSATYIENAVRMMLDNNLMLVFGKRIRLGRDYSDAVEETRIFRDGFFAHYLDTSQPLPHLSTLYHRETAKQLDFYKDDIISTDRVSVLNMAYDHPVGYLGQVAGGWRETGENISRELDMEKRLRNVALPYLVTRAIRNRKADPARMPARWDHRYAGQIIANYTLLFLLKRRPWASIRFLSAALVRYPALGWLYGTGKLAKKVITRQQGANAP